MKTPFESGLKSVSFLMIFSWLSCLTFPASPQPQPCLPAFPGWMGTHSVSPYTLAYAHTYPVITISHVEHAASEVYPPLTAEDYLLSREGGFTTPKVSYRGLLNFDLNHCKLCNEIESFKKNIHTRSP